MGITFWSHTCKNARKNEILHRNRKFSVGIAYVADVVGIAEDHRRVVNHVDVMRYREIQKAVSQATAKMLCQQLRELQADGIIHRKLYPGVPPKTEYRLTELGKTLVPIVHAMSDWGHEYFEYLGLPDPCHED